MRHALSEVHQTDSPSASNRESSPLILSSGRSPRLLVRISQFSLFSSRPLSKTQLAAGAKVPLRIRCPSAPAAQLGCCDPPAVFL